MDTLAVAEFEHINEMQDTLRNRMRESQRKDGVGRGDTLRSTVLGSIVAEEYQRAKDEIAAYVELKFAYPGFQRRVERLVQHCSELVDAIKMKRNFPGLAQLTLSKQQEIHEKVLEHFDDLKRHLRQIEKVEREHKLEDVRSTVWVLRALATGVGVVAFIAFLLDAKNGAFAPFLYVTDGYLEGFTRWFVNMLPF